MVIGNKPCATTVFTRNLHTPLDDVACKRRSAALVAEAAEAFEKMSSSSLYDPIARHQIALDARLPLC
jgi:hypothetical protein